MARKKRQLSPDELITVTVHPAVHSIVSHQSIDTGQTIRQRYHAILCDALGRPDLKRLDVSTRRRTTQAAGA